MRTVVIAAIVLALTGCTAPQVRPDTEWRATSARLFITDANGAMALPDGRPVVDIDHKFGIIDGAVSLAPGGHLVSRACPTLPDRILAMHGAPSVWYEFEAGRDYVLSCQNGGLVIEPFAR